MNKKTHRDLLPDIIDREGAVLPPGFDSWGLKSVHPDLTTAYGFKWAQPGGRSRSDHALAEGNHGACPERPGDGLCVATTWAGMASGGIPARTMLLVAYRSEDILGRSAGKLRVSCEVAVIALVDGERLLREAGSGADLRDANLRYADLSGANLSGADLRDADLRGADLRYAHLSRANLYSAGLSGANLSGADLSGADLRYAHLSGADLSDADLSDADLSDAGLSRANLSRANLSGADLSGADLRYAHLSGADLSDADLSRANLYRANLSGADLSGADLSGADLSGAVCASLPDGWSLTDAGVAYRSEREVEQ